MIDAPLLWMRAQGAMRAGRHGDALEHLFQLARAVDRINFEYEEWIRALGECLRHAGRGREAAACAAYLGSTHAGSPEELQEELAGARAGDGRKLRGIRQYAIYLAHAGHHRAAAVWFAAVDMPVHRAVALERAGEDAEAAAVWQRLLDEPRLREGSYERALVLLNRALCLLRLGDERARDEVYAATSAVEQVADAFESEGLRERAFDCYQLLARVGSETGAFENVAEGYLNSVRILQADGLKLDAVRLYESFVTLARRFGEWHAAASVLREAADDCLGAGLPYAEDLRLRAGEAWLHCAAEAERDRLPVSMVENALLAAAECFASVRAFRQVAEVYQRLAELELGAHARARYERLARRLAAAPPDPPRPVPVPDFLKQLPEYDEIWYVDLAEWELAGDPALTAAGIVSDRHYPDIVRRHALLLVLDVELGLSPRQLVAHLEAIRAYPVIACLEAAFDTPDPSTRQAVAKAAGSLRFKRSFSLIHRALRDPEPAVRAAAARSVGRLVFPHAFEPLRAIFRARDVPDADEARRQALRAIGRVQTVEAVDFLCDRLREGVPEYVEIARSALAEVSAPELAPYLRRQLDLVPAEDRVLIERVLARLG